MRCTSKERIVIIKSSAPDVSLHHRSGERCPCMDYRDGNRYSAEWHNVVNPAATHCNGTGLINVQSVSIPVYASIQRLSATTIQQLNQSGKVLDIGLLYSNGRLAVGFVSKSSNEWIDIESYSGKMSISVGGLEYYIDSSPIKPTEGSLLTYCILKPRS